MAVRGLSKVVGLRYAGTIPPKMETYVNESLCPVACPVCGESQNTLPGAFDPDRQPFGPVHCMVCGHQFSAHEYQSGLEIRRRKLASLAGVTTSS